MEQDYKKTKLKEKEEEEKRQKMKDDVINSALKQMQFKDMTSNFTKNLKKMP